MIHIKNAVTKSKKGDTQVVTAIKHQRVLDMVSKPSSVAKNRFGITQDIIFHWAPEAENFTNPLAPIYKFPTA